MIVISFLISENNTDISPNLFLSQFLLKREKI